MNHYYESFESAYQAAGFDKPTIEDIKLLSRFEGQDELFKQFRAGKHIILKAPTGWGKTFAVVAALGDGHTIYSLPLRVLVNSLSDSAAKYSAGHVIAHHGTSKQHASLDPILEGSQTREHVDIVFTTLDQTLSAFLGIPIGVKHGKGNTMPAVVDASHLVFDEFHLFDPERSMATALFALERSRKNCIVLTATLSEVMIDHLKEVLNRSPLENFDEDQNANKVEVIRGERPYFNDKRIHVGAGLDENLPEMEGQLVIVMRNQTEWAKSTYAELIEKYKNQPVDIYLLHSEFLPHHRAKIEHLVRSRFGPTSDREVSDRKQILVSTQVIEAGLDITCDEMHTDVCPSASFIQRIGRAARYNGESAEVYVHPVENYQPYAAQRENIERLLTNLLAIDGQILSEVTEDELVQLSADRDRAFVKSYNCRNAEAEVGRLRTLRAYEGYRDMIRSIDSVAVAVGDLEDSHYGQCFHFISVSTSAFYNERKYKNVNLKAFRWNPDDKAFQVFDVSNEKNYLQLADFVLLDYESVGYSPERGLFLLATGALPQGKEFFTDNKESGISFTYAYELEPYQAHLKLLVRQKRKFKWMLNYLAQHLEYISLAAQGEGATTADALVDLVIWCHDLGKLSLKWQAGHGIEEGFGGVEDDYPGLSYIKGLNLTLVEGPSPIAHSEPVGQGDDGREGNQYFRRTNNLPSHAWISAWAAKDLIIKCCDGYLPLALPIIWAIAEHHGYLRNRDGVINSARFKSYELGFLNYLDSMSSAEPFAKYGWNSGVLTTKIDFAESQKALAWFEGNNILPEHHVEVYYILSYLLRRCDWAATAMVSKTIEK